MDKFAARQQVKLALAAIAVDQYIAWSQVVYERIRQLIAVRRPRTVLLYAASSRWREVDLSALVRDLPDVTFDTVPASADAPLPTTSYDMIVVPLYGYRPDGYRLGHGSGWYDQLLAAQPQAYAVGAGFSVQQVDFTTEPHDRVLDMIVTEN